MEDTQVDQPIEPTQTQQSGAGDTTGDVGSIGSTDYERKLSDLAAENKKYRQNYVKYKSELEDTQSALRDLQEQGLKEQGKFKDLYDKTAKELATERTHRQNDRAQWTGHVVASQFAAEAVKAGCREPMALVKIANADGLLSEPGLVSDDSFEVNRDALQQIVEKAKTENQILFAKATPKIADGAPTSGAGNTVTRPDLSKMSQEDLIEMAKRM